MELKFRAWDEGKKMMFPVTWMRFSPVKPFACLPTEEVREEYEGREYNIMQFTGFQDKNGKDIYFNDIVKFSYKDPQDSEFDDDGEAVIVHTMSNGVGIISENINGETYAVSDEVGGVIQEIWEDEDVWDIEVIGNIFEDEDMLMTKEEWENAIKKQQ